MLSVRPDRGACGISGPEQTPNGLRPSHTEAEEYSRRKLPIPRTDRLRATLTDFKPFLIENKPPLAGQLLIL